MKFTKILIFLGIIYFSVFGQTSSIFSNTRVGLGLSNHFLSAAAMGMGNAGLAKSDSINLNFFNYSQWSKIGYTYFGFQVEGEKNSFKIDDLTGTKSNATIGGLMLSVPIISNKIGSFLTFQPVYNMNHKMYETINEGTELEYDNYLTRKGHISQLNLGLNYNTGKLFQVAANLIYYTGAYKDEYYVNFDTSAYSDLYFFDRYRLQGYGVGLSGTINLKNVSAGFYIEKISNIKFEKEISIISAPYGIGGGTGMKATTSLPLNAGFGLAVKFSQQLSGAFDVIYKNWKRGVPTSVDGNLESDYFEDIFQYNGGVEYSPRVRWNSPLYKKIIKRFGFSVGNEGIKFNSQSVNFMGLSAGLGIPMNTFGARVDLGIMAGVRGDMEQNGAKERFIKVGFGIKTGEKWFLRRTE